MYEGTKFSSRLKRVIYDKAHCISQWASFRAEFKLLGSLRWLVPDNTPSYLTSATLPGHILSDTLSKLGLQGSDRPKILHRSNDRRNIRLAVRPIKHTQTSYYDLAYLVPLKSTDANPLRKFLAYFNNRTEAEDAVKELWKRVDHCLRSRIVWFHSGMTERFKKRCIKRMADGELWGMCCTDAAGMVSENHSKMEMC